MQSGLVPAIRSSIHGQLLKHYRKSPITVNTDPVSDGRGRPDNHPSKEFLAIGTSAMVSSDVPLCSRMGAEIMQRGGNAADAAVTVALCIGSVNSHSSGIGGGAYILSTTANESVTIDAREMAPAGASKNMFESFPLLSQVGGLAVAVPGELKGLYALHTRHGSGNLTWNQLFEPVVQLNRAGFATPLVLARALAIVNDLALSKIEVLRENWDFIFLDNDKKSTVTEGDWVTRPRLADTLELIGKSNSCDIFYAPDGPIAPKLVDTVKRLGGMMELSDFEGYSAKILPPINFSMEANGEQYEVLTTSGASSGLALVAGLNFYSKLQKERPVDHDDEVLQTHRIIEAMKWTSAARTNLGDVNETYWSDIKNHFTSPAWAEDILKSGLYSDDKTFPWRHYGPKYEQTGTHGTSHFTVVDNQGGAVGMTTTVNLLFGSLVYDNATGVVLNNEMDDFSQPGRHNAFDLSPSILNYIAPFKRPLSLMAPTIIKKNGEIDLLIGCAGGSRIVTAILHAIIRSVFFNVPLLETIAWPRIHHQLIPTEVMVENTTLFNDLKKDGKVCVLCDLQKKKHTIAESGTLTAMNAIKRAGNKWHGVSDFWRKRGIAAGF